VGTHVKKFKVGDLAGTGCLVDSAENVKIARKA
jgi:D-arabinose 1-dehydrogenase-like Zn-dependent alcohol dehydrogenase